MSYEATLEKVSKVAAAADPLGATVKFVFKGGEGVIFIDGSQDPNTVSTEDKEAECSISVDKGDFDKLMSGDMNPMMAFMSGKLKIEGNMGIAMKLSSLFG
ncbi:MAG: SCP2 sterol-binding domain-containing protein [Bacteroidia bacterium]|nr:SCP2 sterol-binding domain-containing protein [Bacteroidia bacterium]